MADRIGVTSLILGNLSRAMRLVSLGVGRRLACSGLLDLRSQAKLASALRTDTSKQVGAGVLALCVGRKLLDQPSGLHFGDAPVVGFRLGPADRVLDRRMRRRM